MALNFLKKMVNPLINYWGEKKVESEFSDTPIMIGGCGRSGTTLLLSIIGAHPNIFALPQESTTFANWKRVNEDKEVSLEPERFDRFYRMFLLNRITSQVTRWCEKTPRNVLYFKEILDYFDSQIKLIHIIRDGRDVMLSQHPVEPDRYWVNPKRWVRDVKAGLKFKEHPQVLTIKYEDLILEYESTIEKICEFIDEECTAELYNWFKNTNVKKSKAWSKSESKIHSRSIAKWKRTENETRVEEIMKNEEVVQLLEKLNYITEEE
ncbi:MAG: sulfotransferase family protein [Bacillota bacterium]